MGDRMDNIHPGAMPWLHRYVGNPVLTGILNLFFRTGVNDAHCGMRALRRDVLPRLDLRTTGMEFASEMVIRASKEKLDIRQFPIEYHPRGGESKLSSFRDGWRHLRFLLVHSPTHLFMVPGAVLLVVGALVALTSLTQVERPRPRVGAALDGRRRAADDRRRPGRRARACARTPTARTSWASATRGSTACAPASGSSTGCCWAAPSCVAGLVMAAIIVITWIDRGFGALSEERLAILAATLIDHRGADLLLVVPALDPRPAPPRLMTPASRAVLAVAVGLVVVVIAITGAPLAARSCARTCIRSSRSRRW